MHPHVQGVGEHQRSGDGIIRFFVKGQNIPQALLDVLRLDPLLLQASLSPPPPAGTVPVRGKVSAERVAELSDRGRGSARVALRHPPNLPPADRVAQLEEQASLLAVEVQLLRGRARREVVHEIVDQRRHHDQRDQPPRVALDQIQVRCGAGGDDLADERREAEVAPRARPDEVVGVLHKPEPVRVGNVVSRT
jgi:hypothetical protein